MILADAFPSAGLPPADRSLLIYNRVMLKGSAESFH